VIFLLGACEPARQNVKVVRTLARPGFFETAEYLNMFFENLLLGGKHKLKNRDMHINRDTDKVPINNTDKQKQVILDIISANNEVTTKSLCPALNVGEERIKKLLQQLVKEEKIVALGSNKNRTYRLNKNLCKSV
jgi:predicted HTH transcriptional regulator